MQIARRADPPSYFRSQCKGGGRWFNVPVGIWPCEPRPGLLKRDAFPLLAHHTHSAKGFP
jgi:hypothetical protein